MMRALLENRFSLKIHRETRDYPVYELTVAKGGPKLETARPGACVKIDPDHLPQPPPTTLCGAVRMSPDREHLEMSGVTMGDFCNQFSAMLDREVLDKTGLTGAFDLKLTLSAEDLGFGPATPDPDGMFIALRGALQKVGLKLDTAKGSAEFLAIDRIQRPSEN
jgi:uncharacterized protein (TIGR03435 family)